MVGGLFAAVLRWRALNQTEVTAVFSIAVTLQNRSRRASA
jgi:hypothetical protein